MALLRHRQQESWPERFESRVPDWPFRPFETMRRMFEDEEVKVEEFVEDGKLVVRADLPGVDPAKDIDVSTVDGKLCIRAERRHEEQVEGRDYRRSEFRYGAISRVIPLPPNVNESDISASYKDGVLEVRTPIQETSAATSKIPIERK